MSGSLPKRIKGKQSLGKGGTGMIRVSFGAHILIQASELRDAVVTTSQDKRMYTIRSSVNQGQNKEI